MIEGQAPRVALCTIFMVNIELRNNFICEKVLYHKVGYPVESDVLRSKMSGSAVMLSLV